MFAPLIPRLNRVWTGCIGDNTIADVHSRQHFAVQVDRGAAGGLDGIPRVERSRGNNQDIIYGELLFPDSGRRVIATGGIIILRAFSAYTVADNGLGVVGSGRRGSVRSALTGGFGKIIGGGAIYVQARDREENCFIVDADYKQK